MPLEDLRFPVVVMRRTCARNDHYLARLPADSEELAEYRRICGLDPADILTLASAA